MKAVHTRHGAYSAPLLNAPSFRPLSQARCFRAKRFPLSLRTAGRRLAGTPISQQVQAASADQDVKTADIFRFSHSVSTNTFEVKGDLNKIFRYAADFSHIDRWDSGTTDAKLRESDSRPALKAGDTVALMTVLFGIKSSTVYQLLEVDTPNKVVFFGISRFHESTDTVTFQQRPGAKDVVIVKYKTDIELVRWYRWFQPMLGFVMANLAKEAVEGMQVKLQQLQEKGEFAPEKSSAPETAAAAV